MDLHSCSQIYPLKLQNTVCHLNKNLSRQEPKSEEEEEEEKKTFTQEEEEPPQQNSGGNER